MKKLNKPFQIKDFPVALRLQCKSLAALRGMYLGDLITEYCKEGISRHKKAMESVGRQGRITK